MPLAVDNLTPDSSPVAVRDAVSASIEQCMAEPIPVGTQVDNKQKWCSGKAHGIARTNTGKETI